MPAHLHDIAEKVRARLRALFPEVHPDHQRTINELLASPMLEEACRFTLEAVELGIDKQGYLFDPKPAPRPSSVVSTRQSGVRWSGSRGPRRRR